MPIPVGSEQRPRDLAAACFVALAEEFFDEDGTPIPFDMPDKKDTQDDPFDQLVSQRLERRLPSGVKVLRSGKRLVSPDLVVARPEEASPLINGGEVLDERRMIAIEVKSLNANTQGGSVRGPNMDFNSTPPCSRVSIYAKNGRPLAVPAFYLCAILFREEGKYLLQAMALVEGAVISQDADLYRAITGIRRKDIGLGTYGDAFDRKRPMLVFTNPFGWPWMRDQPTLMHHRDDLAEEQSDLHRVRQIIRTAKDGTEHEFWAYRVTESSPEGIAVDPFPRPKTKRETSQRGRFTVDL